MRSYYYFNRTATQNLQHQAEQESPAFLKKEDPSPFFGDKSAGSEKAHFFSGNNNIQTKSLSGLSIGQPDDKYELEADAMADQVVQKLQTPSNTDNPHINRNKGNAVQRKCPECEQEEKLQTKKESLADNISTLQRKPIFESEEDSPAEQVQRKCAACVDEELQRKGEETIEEQQGITAKADKRFTVATAGLQDNLHDSRGGGAPLPKETKSDMESAFGVDFGDVRVHTGNRAIQMNRDLHAQAFTHGADIYFNQGKYDTASSTGQRLLAHELTHVVQQNSSKENNVQRVCDNIPEAENQFYGHGAYMGAAPQLMADPKWNRILEVLMPDVHSDVTNAMSEGQGSDQIILMFENNPVMAAYGMYQTHQMDLRNERGRSDRIENTQAIEWDIFLPNTLVDQYNETEDEEEQLRLAGEIVNEMVIAHGTTSQTVRENLLGIRQYGNVLGTRKSHQGGVRPGAWMDLFGRALRLASTDNWEEIADEYQDPELHPRINNPRDQSSHQTFETQMSFRDVIHLYRSIFNKETFSVLLDIKSRDATPTILRAVVTELNRRGVHVYGIGSFQHREISGIGTMEQVVDGETYSGPREIKFFHLSGDLQNACLHNEISENDHVMFNAGSLINYDRIARGPQKKASYEINTQVVNQLRTYKYHYGFHLGVYVQENDIDDRAATLITQLTNDNPDIFDLGFAWGGLSGQTASDIEPTFTNATVGVYNQRTVGTYWDTSQPVPSSPAPVGSGFTSTISISHRYLESRRFDVSTGQVIVTCNGAWNRSGCSPDTYYINLLREIDFWPDSSKGSMGYPVGALHSATWSDLEPGTYYLIISFINNTNPNCTLEGDITVSI